MRELDQDLGFLMRRTSQAVRERLRLKVEQYGLTFQEYQVLSVLGLDRATQAGLARTMGLDRSVLGRLLRRMERKGLCTREPSAADGRVKLVALTESGKRLLEDLESP